tara:strand:- start:517 stop:693 length:177 start_codon:yes stop_codon:yes gene_type:complete
LGTAPLFDFDGGQAWKLLKEFQSQRPLRQLRQELQPLGFRNKPPIEGVQAELAASSSQ